ncbi:hypothetical protein GGTG_00459 [Gaeumannomyces tritici R3-111a-1]|uniref:Uncharacterized protein n=1 Tax=Gaeumannomyces tritici (strain R3-111a-1) TaxID=644352 RepID=J3NGS0_GAET3|nr:hypothetical protein GGTG_00459 [Gaeumannomyces tritici R3-111a-1]EJT80460.1 hypothetical protein GGTG_00459 [Gaeumannomyces tritici R3-111a-1]
MRFLYFFCFFLNALLISNWAFCKFNNFVWHVGLNCYPIYLILGLHDFYFEIIFKCKINGLESKYKANVINHLSVNYKVEKLIVNNVIRFSCIRICIVPNGFKSNEIMYKGFGYVTNGRHS